MKILSLAFALALSLSALAQPLVETIEVRITNVDVVVTDRSGKPVHGLTKDDFEILEAGKPQAITNFYEIQGEAAPGVPGAEAARSAPEVPPEVARRRIVVFVDNYSIHPHTRKQALEALEKSLDTLMRPGDQVMLVSWNNSREIAFPLTSDRSAILERFKAAQMQTTGAFVIEATKNQVIDYATALLEEAKTGRRLKFTDAYSMSTASARSYAEQLWSAHKTMVLDLQRTIATMAGVEGKKVLVFLGAELPVNPGQDIFARVDSMYLQYMKNIQPSVAREPSRSLAAEMRGVARQANAHGVTMYMIDASDRRSISAEHSLANEAEADFLNEAETQMAMASIAQATGGITIPGGKLFDSAIRTISRDLESYYSLGFRSPDGSDPDRRIQVKVKRDGLRVRSRQTYVSKSADEAVRERVAANVLHGQVKSDFPVAIEVSAPAKQPSGHYQVQLKVTFPSTITLIPEGDHLKGEFAIFIVTGNSRGGLSRVSSETRPMTFPKGAQAQLEAQKHFVYSSPLVIAGGEQIISVAIADKVAGTSGFARTTVVAQ